GPNEVRSAVYRAALKLRTLQKLCQMHLVSLQDLRPVLNTLSSSGEPVIGLAQEDVQQHLEDLFQSISHELPDEAVPEATNQTTRLLFKLFDREHTGVILLRSVEAALIALCGDTLSAKQRALFRLAESYSGNQKSDRGSISRNALKILLEDLSQVNSARVTEGHFIGWLQSEPRLLLWLSTLYRISVSEAVQHRVRCHACKAFPITGLSAPSPALQSVADPDMHNAPEISLTATPAAVPVESKGLQTEETELPQRETAILQKDLSVTQKAMRDLQRDKWLLEKEFQVWRVAAQSEHDSLEDTCTELKTMMEALNQHNQHLEEEVDRVRHMLCVRDRDQLRIDIHSHSDLQPEHDDSISEKDWTHPGCLKPQDSSSEEEQVQEGKEAYQEGRIEVDEETLYDVSENIFTNLDDTEEDVRTASEQQEEVEEEELQEELPHKTQNLSLLHRSMSDLALEEHSDSDDSEMDEEEELCELVQRLRNELSLYTATGSVSLQKEKLMSAAEGVRDSVSHLVTSVRTTSLA
ncbi:hypothetical protein cypCar_00029404, partial [Cyprinus carpio]